MALSAKFVDKARRELSENEENKRESLRQFREFIRNHRFIKSCRQGAKRKFSNSMGNKRQHRGSSANDGLALRGGRWRGGRWREREWRVVGANAEESDTLGMGTK